MSRSLLLFLSVASGCLLAAAWPEIGNISFLAFIGLIPLLYLESELQKIKASALKMVLFVYPCMFLWNILTTWWVYFASFAGAAMAIVLNALFISIVFVLFSFIKRRLGERVGYLSLVSLWIGWEYIHMNWDLTWPWLTLGNVFANDITWIQWYEFTGHLGGSVWVLISNLFGFLALRTYQNRNKKLLIGNLAVFFFIVFLPIIVSYTIYSNYEEKQNPVKITVVQPNIDPYNEKFSGLGPIEQLDKLLRLSATKLDSSVQYLVAPETAIVRNLMEEDVEKFDETKMLKKFLEKYPNLNIVIGLSSATIYRSESEKSNSARASNNGEYWYDYFNSAMQVNASDKIPIYHKSRLVPGVENLPFKFITKYLVDLAIDLGGTTGSLGTQENRDVFTSLDEQTKIAPVICYESVYGEYVADYIKNGANFIFIVTNDGWWENTPGYKQHLAYARMRAIEVRRSIARSANTGISCFINQKGELSQTTDWWKEDCIVQEINSNDEFTFFAVHGDYLARLSLFMNAIILLWTIVKRILPKK
ncbi:MAG: apolipoprotein N-acyltransferase [Flavobacteriales bacterium]|nr:apolipoprotein N-acyltransferase [Flavobacteriales bacterium]